MYCCFFYSMEALENIDSISVTVTVMILPHCYACKANIIASLI